MDYGFKDLYLEKYVYQCDKVCMFVCQAGDRVFTTATVGGGYAEYTLAADDCVHKLPDALDFDQGAAIGIPYFTAYRALVHK